MARSIPPPLWIDRKRRVSRWKRRRPRADPKRRGHPGVHGPLKPGRPGRCGVEFLADSAPCWARRRTLRAPLV